MSYFMSFEFCCTSLYWVSCIQFIHISFLVYHVVIYIYIFFFLGGGYVLPVFVKDYIMFLCIIWCSCWEYFFILFI